MTETPEQWMPATNEQAARLIDLIDELSACVRDGKSMGLGDVSIVNGIRAKFLDALLTEWCDGVKTEPVREDLLKRLEAQRLAALASSLGEPVSQEAPAEEEIDFSGPTPRPIVFTGCNGQCVAEGGYPALCEMYPDNRHVGCSRQTRVRCCGALTVHAYDCKRDTARPACATCKREIHTSLPVDFCSEECRSAFSGIPNSPVISSASPLSEDEARAIESLRHLTMCQKTGRADYAGSLNLRDAKILYDLLTKDSPCIRLPLI